MVKTAASLILSLALIAGDPATAVSDERTIVLDHPIPVTLTTNDGEIVTGDAVILSPQGLRLQLHTEDDADDEASSEIPWSRFTPQTVYRIHRQLMDQTAAEEWLMLGRRLRSLPGGGELSVSALEVAELLDPALAEQVEAVRQIEPPPAVQPAAPGSTVNPLLSGEAKPTAAGSGEPGKSEELDEDDLTASYTWGGFASDDRPGHVAEVRAFADRVAQTLDVEFTVVETNYFLYFTNVPPRETFHSPRLLDQMYDKACDLYGIPRGLNIFKGKCPVFMFATQDQFKQYAAAFGGPAWAAGFCQQSGNGDVRIVMFQGEDRGYAIQTMLHETAHGVSWRHRTPQQLPPWLEEGIAEWLASHTTSDYRYVTVKKRHAADHLQRTPRLPDNLFGGSGIREMWEYGASLAMTELLIGNDRERFVTFVSAIKDGQNWETALTEHYGLTVEAFIQRFGRSLGVRDLSR